MKQQLEFYRCSRCGNLVELIEDAGVPLHCCGQPMERLTPNTTDAAQEKHLPVVRRSEGAVEVSVGSAPHPMAEEHLIEWVALQTEQGTQRRCLGPQGQPACSFQLSQGDRPVAVYSYCNLHGLWKQDLN